MKTKPVTAGNVWAMALNKRDGEAVAAAKTLLPLSINGAGGELRRLIYSPDRAGKDRRQLNGRLDTRRIVSAYTGRSDVFYRQWQVVGENTAVTLLVDVSQSMEGEKAVMAGVAAYGIAQQLARSDAEFEVVGFSSVTSPGQQAINPWAMSDVPTGTGTGTTENNQMFEASKCHVTLLEYKGWGQSLRQCERDLLYGIPRSICTVAGGTPDAEGIIACIDRLLARNVQRRVMIVLTDGRGNRGEAATLEACRRAAKARIDVIGIGIQDKSVVCYPHHVVVNNLNDLSRATLRKVVDVITVERKKRGDA